MIKFLIGAWCNGNTTVFGAVVPGSNPSVPTFMGGSSRGPGLKIFILATRIRIPYPLQVHLYQMMVKAGIRVVGYPESFHTTLAEGMI